MAKVYNMLMTAFCKLQHSQSIPPSVMNNGIYLHTPAVSFSTPSHIFTPKVCSVITLNPNGVDNNTVIL